MFADFFDTLISSIVFLCSSVVLLQSQMAWHCPCSQSCSKILLIKGLIFKTGRPAAKFMELPFNFFSFRLACLFAVQCRTPSCYGLQRVKEPRCERNISAASSTKTLRGSTARKQPKLQHRLNGTAQMCKAQSARNCKQLIQITQATIKSFQRFTRIILFLCSGAHTDGLSQSRFCPKPRHLCWGHSGRPVAGLARGAGPLRRPPARRRCRLLDGPQPRRVCARQRCRVRGRRGRGRGGPWGRPHRRRPLRREARARALLAGPARSSGGGREEGTRKRAGVRRRDGQPVRRVRAGHVVGVGGSPPPIFLKPARVNKQALRV